MELGMRILAVATTLVVALLTGASLALAADIGANDDSAKFADDGGAALFAQMTSLGLKQTVIGVRFVPSDPTTVQDKPQLDRAIASASAAGLRVVLAVYPYPPRELEAGLGSPATFASYVGVLASIYPEVKEFVIGNEPNQPAFWRPQFDPSGQNASAAAFGPYLAAAYDTLKAVNPEIEVVGVGLSPRGNDYPKAKSNISTSPVRFLRALGDWYRRSGRTRPLMDGFSFHPYPNKATDPLARGYAWPNIGFANLDRLKQALWDAFEGTPQPTTLTGLRLHLDEVGWQVDTTGRAGYHGVENVPVTDEATQASIYAELVHEANCDPDIASVSFFGFHDDGLRTGFQAGLFRADGSPRAAAAAVETAIADAAAMPCAPQAQWRPGMVVSGARVAVAAKGSTITARVEAGEDVRARVCVRPALGPKKRASRCRAASVAGFHPASVALAIPRTDVRVRVAIDLTATANHARRLHVVKEAVLRG
jgi:hypothetical protein